MPDYSDNHICANCGQKRGAHAGATNPHAKPGACPPGEFPAWPRTIRDEGRAGRVFDRRVRKFWEASESTFKPRT